MAQEVKVLSMSINADVKDALEAYALSSGRTMRSIVEKSIVDFLEEYKNATDPFLTTEDAEIVEEFIRKRKEEMSWANFCA